MKPELVSTHQHGQNCGHTAIVHDDHVDYIQDGRMHHLTQEGELIEHTIEDNPLNPSQCRKVSCDVDHALEGAEVVPHGDHVDYIVQKRLHHRHGDHCDDHGPVLLN